MKKLALLMFILMLTPMAFAKIEQFSTPINVTIFNNTFKVATEDLQTRTYSCGTNLKEVMTAKLYRNTSCREEDLYNYITTVTGIYNGSSVSIYELESCKSNVNSLKGLVFMANTSLTYKDQLASCTAQAAPVATPTAIPTACVDPLNNPQCVAAIDAARKLAPPAQSSGGGGTIIIALIAGFIGFMIGRGNLAKTSTDGMRRV